MKSISHGDGFAALILADDLTGACDAAAPFADRMHVQVALTAERVPQADVVAVNLGSRDMPIAAARTKLQSAAQLLCDHKPQLFLKKIDSAFRGNTFEEIAICLELLPHPVAILAPAFPSMGRKVRSGHVVIEDIVGHSVLDLATSLRKHDVRCSVLKSPSELGAESLRKCLLAAKEDGVRLILPDAETEADLNLLAQVGLQLGRDVLWFGSAGLSHAFAQMEWMPDHAMMQHTPQAAGPVVFCIGSDHPVTQRQIQYLKREGAVVEVYLGATACQDMRLALRDSSNILVCMDAEQYDPAKIGDWLRPVVQSIAALVLSGGDTAAMVCDALAVETIELGGELLPGIPSGWLRGGPADGLTVATKSGGFGQEDALLRIAQLLQSEIRTKA